MKTNLQRKFWIGCLLLLSGLLIVQPVLADPSNPVESPPQGTSPDEFATDYSGCLGSLRSAIARGEFDGVGPFEEHFNGSVNPGAHQGTVGEEEFLATFFGLEGEALREFCAQF